MEEKKVMENEVVEEKKVATETKNKKNDKPKKSKVKIILNRLGFGVFILFILYFGANMIFGIIDFYKLKDKEEPAFAKKTNTYPYENGEVIEYRALSYRIYEYKEGTSYRLQLTTWFQEHSPIE